MLINVLVKPSQKFDRLWAKDEGILAGVRVAAKDAELNAHLKEVIANRFNIPEKLITLVKGQSSMEKLVAISVPEEKCHKILASLDLAPDQKSLF